jgi:hypothetical protein
MRRRERAGCLFHFQFSPAEEWEALDCCGASPRDNTGTCAKYSTWKCLEGMRLWCRRIAVSAKSLPIAADPFCAYLQSPTYARRGI